MHILLNFASIFRKFYAIIAKFVFLSFLCTLFYEIWTYIDKVMGFESYIHGQKRKFLEKTENFSISREFFRGGSASAPPLSRRDENGTGGNEKRDSR